MVVGGQGLRGGGNEELLSKGYSFNHVRFKKSSRDLLYSMVSIVNSLYCTLKNW